VYSCHTSSTDEQANAGLQNQCGIINQRGWLFRPAMISDVEESSFLLILLRTVGILGAASVSQKAVNRSDRIQFATVR
jgi:hypothetical protein